MGKEYSWMLSWRMNRFFWMIFFLFMAFIANAAPQKRPQEEEKRKTLEAAPSHILAEKKNVRFDYGAWVNFLTIDYTNNDNNAEDMDSLDELYEVDTRLWFKTTIKPAPEALNDDEHMLYVRFKDLNSHLLPRDTAGGYDHDGPHLDYAYWTSKRFPHKIEIGRRYFAIGRGIAYSNVNDGLQWNYTPQDWDLEALVAHTLPHEDNIDASVPGYSKNSDRFYYGLGLSHPGWGEQQLYTYGLIQRDQSDEDPTAADQHYAYNSHYVGAGVEGAVWAADYWLEVIKEGGTSYVFGTNAKSEVDAWAVDIGVEKEFPLYGRPEVSLEYALGSGDSDRIIVTDTELGNISGDDHNFLYFGYFPAGYALAPRLSNIQIYRGSVTCHPWQKVRWLRHFSLGVDYYRYYKHKAKGWISDLDASLVSQDIGSEVDVTLSWQILSDLRWAIRFGHFRPGEAYPDSANDPENYLSNSITITF
ncbi:MAG TPA: hypothetical protein DD723_10285 [Candidatus Omnitrophica bacterium]|uniref:Alginate export domain-containing protein n=1 Tax=Candidatus Kaiserbacteria bacterium GW2011_GWA2_49_19 TaxID=1618669 RepID=A0A0G1VPI3_9BACT|nr:MAG: hypothetical protein UY44_C0011G0007 [Candidatus Kaiserbacteria bacterium GW2011_GWA2_49_19]HBR15905.1 hypothetical protein [Candidatus Omnitrophota bacterium]